MFLGVEGITPVWQVEAAKYPRNKFCCLGAQSPRCWSPGWGSGLPRGRPQHFWFLWSSAQVDTIGKGSQGSPEKENPRQQRSLVKPKFLLQYPSLSLPLSLAAEAAHASPGRERAPAGGGARAVPRVWRAGGRLGHLPAPRGGRSHDACTARPQARTPTPRLQGATGSGSGSPWPPPPKAKP